MTATALPLPSHGSAAPQLAASPDEVWLEFSVGHVIRGWSAMLRGGRIWKDVGDLAGLLRCNEKVLRELFGDELVALDVECALLPLDVFDRLVEGEENELDRARRKVLRHLHEGARALMSLAEAQTALDDLLRNFPRLND